MNSGKLIKSLIIGSIVAPLAISTLASAGVLARADFSTYADGALVGQFGWQRSGSFTTGPLTIAGGTLRFGGNGNGTSSGEPGTRNEDAVLGFAPLAGPRPDGASLVVNFDMTVAIHTAGGPSPSYFAALTSGPTQSVYNAAIAARAVGTGFTLMVKNDGAAGNAGYVYGADEAMLNFGQIYAVRTELHMVAGQGNDFMRVYVGSDFETLSLHAVLDSGSDRWGVFQDFSPIDSLLIRQHASVTQFESDVTLYNMEVWTVPAPGALAIFGLAGLARSRRR